MYDSKMDLLDWYELFEDGNPAEDIPPEGWDEAISDGFIQGSQTDSESSSDDEIYASQSSQLGPNAGDCGSKEEGSYDKDPPNICWRHFERHFDYMVDRNLRPVEEYVLGRAQIMTESSWKSYHITQNNIVSSVGAYSGCLGTSLRTSLSDLVHAYKLAWKGIIGTYECYNEDKTNTMQYLVEREFQKLFDNAETVESPWLGSITEDGGFNTSTSRISASNGSRDDCSSSPGGNTPNLFTSPERDEHDQQRMTQHINTTPVSITRNSATVTPLRNTFRCPGYVRSSSEMLNYLERDGCDQFYTFMDQLFAGLDGCRAGSRYVYALDLLVAVLRLMPEYITLLIRPKFTRDLHRGRRLSYFKRLIIMVRSFLKYMGMESQLLTSDMYRDSSSGCFTPFYLVSGEHDLPARQAKSAMTATILLRLLRLASFIGEKCVGWVFLCSVPVKYCSSIVQRLKRFVYMPIFTMKQVHELILPMTGTFNCTGACFYDFDYLQWIKAYLYPPPPLYLLRQEVVKLLRLCVLTTRTNVSGFYSSINEALLTDNGRSIGVHYEDILRRQIFMLVTGLSFFLAPEFLNICVGNPEVFFGGYFTVLPHVHYSYQTLDVGTFIEKETYKLQEHVIDMLKITVDNDVLSHDDLLGMQGIPRLQSTIIRRILGLAWHYATSQSSDDRPCPVKADRVAKRKHKEEKCRGNCIALTPYSATCSVEFLDRIKPSTVEFKCNFPDMEAIKCTMTTADEIEEMVRNQEESINHSRTSENDHDYVLGGFSYSNPIEIICDIIDEGSNENDMFVDNERSALEHVTVGPTTLKPCNLRCMLMRHLLWDDHENVQALRWSVVMQSTIVLLRFMGEPTEQLHSQAVKRDSNSLGALTPIWYALVDILCCANVRGELPNKAIPDTYPIRESFLGRKLSPKLRPKSRIHR